MRLLSFRTETGSVTAHARSRPYALVVTLLIGVALVGLVLMIDWQIRRGLQQRAEQSLQSILGANVTALDLWLTQVRVDAERILDNEPTRAGAKQLLQNPGNPPSDSIAENSSLASSLSESDVSSYLGWALLDDARVVVASSAVPWIGQALDVPEDAWSRLAARDAIVTRPFRAPDALTEQGPLSRPGAAIMCAMLPIADGARPIGSLALLIDPLAEFSELMAVTRAGRTGETVAFDREGTLVSPSRFDDQLRSVGLLDNDPLITSVLNVDLRDPGVDLTKGGTATLARPQQPPTKMADQATRGATGSDVGGYNDYRGVPVIGAWRWLPEHGIGVAAKMDVAEAYHALRWLRLGWAGLLILAVIGGWSLTHVDRKERSSARRHKSSSPNRQLGQYELQELIGQGGMGAVYRGTHQLLRREVAIKVLEANEISSQSASRFEREVQMTARLRHHNTIDIYDYGRTDDGTFFYVMEYVDGITLQQLVDDFGPQAPQRVIYLMLQICGSLGEAHQLGMIHRDIKPSNILLTARAGLYDMIKVLDFGLVKHIDHDTRELTRSDGITGTPMYMPPESVRDASTADQRSDLYSVGAVGYTLLTGQPTFEGDSSVDVCLKQLREDPIRPSERIGRPLPEDLQNVLMSCLRKDPEERPMSIEELESALRHCSAAESWSASDAVHWWEVEFTGLEQNKAADEANREGTVAGE